MLISLCMRSMACIINDVKDSAVTLAGGVP